MSSSRGEWRIAGRRIRPLSLVTPVILAVAWEAASLQVHTTAKFGETVLPGWESVFGDSFLRLADYWPGGFGVASVQSGGSESLAGALLAIGYNGAITWTRVLLGLLFGGLIGIGGGLWVGWSRTARRLVLPTANLLRTVPLLAMITLFALWFPGDLVGPVAFVTYGVGVILLVSTVSAIENVPKRYWDYALTLGASRSHIYRTVVVPAIFPELRAGMMISLGVAWTAVLGAEYLGVQAGLGHILVLAEYFTFTGRMVLVTLLFVLFASFSYGVFNRIADRVTRWVP